MDRYIKLAVDYIAVYMQQYAYKFYFQLRNSQMAQTWRHKQGDQVDKSEKLSSQSSVQFIDKNIKIGNWYILSWTCCEASHESPNQPRSTAGLYWISPNLSSGRLYFLWEVVVVNNLVRLFACFVSIVFPTCWLQVA